jgi:hypothetical protein
MDLPAATAAASDFGLFGNLQSVIDLDPKVTHGACQLGMAKQ